MRRNSALHKSVSDLMKWIIWKSCFLKLYVSCYFGVVSLSEKWKSLSHVRLFETPWTIQSMEFSRPRILEWVAFPFSRGSSQLRDWTQVSCVASGFFTAEPQGKQLVSIKEITRHQGNDLIFSGLKTFTHRKQYILLLDIYCQRSYCQKV